MNHATVTSFLVLLVMAFSRPSFAYGELVEGYKSERIPGASCYLSLTARADGSAFVALYTNDDFWGAGKIRADGSVDREWGVNGAALTRTNAIQRADVVLPTKDGGALVVGQRSARFTARGQLDDTYGNGGITDPGSVFHYFGGGAAALQADGSLAMLGYDTSTGVSRLAMTRLDSRGQRDLSFGDQGLVVLPNDSAHRIYAWAITEEGEVEVASYRRGDNGVPVPELHRYPKDFGSSPGYVPDNRLVPRAGLANWMSPLAKVDPQGRLVLADHGFFEMSVTRFGPNGRPEPGFGTGGHRPLRLADYETSAAPLREQRVKALTMEPGGGWTLLVGFTHGFGTFGLYDSGTKAIRLRADGSTDPAFVSAPTLASGRSTTQFAQLDDGTVLATGTTNEGCALAKQRTDTPRAEGAIVEYYHPEGDHYFITLDGFEAGILDNNVAAMGWVRTGQAFGAWQPIDVPGTTPVCRFYGDLTAGPNSHFFTTQKEECDGLRAQAAGIPIGSRAWRLEGMTFAMTDSPDGQCAPNLTPVYRLYNNPVPGKDPNHRYTASKRVYDEMAAKGWIREGVRFCAPPISSRTSTP